MVEADAKAALDWLLKRSRSSEAIPRHRAKRDKTVEADADDIVERAKLADAVQKKDPVEKKNLYSGIVDQLTNQFNISDPVPTNGRECVAGVGPNDNYSSYFVFTIIYSLFVIS